MKKILSVFLCFVMSFITVQVSAAKTVFKDLPSSYWAYQNIMQLNSEGNINGYEDGTFRPENYVTRAEFVKLLGKTNNKSTVEYNDIKKTDWPYDYVMYSGVTVSGNSFLPDAVITRAEAVNFIWQRIGEGKGNDFFVPKMVVDKVPEAYLTSVKWGYTIGLLKGDDGIYIRANEPLSRAEAVTLILRARDLVGVDKCYGVADIIDKKLLENVYNSINIFDSKYVADDNISNGEMVAAAMRIAFHEYEVMYDKFDLDVKFDGLYSRDITFISNELLGKDKNTKEFAEQKATIRDAISVFTYAYTRKSQNYDYLTSSDNYYSDIKSVNSFTENMVLTYANKNGVILNYTGKTDEHITKKQLSALIIQLERLIGSQNSYCNGKIYDEKLLTDIYKYPDDVSGYGPIVESLTDFDAYKADFPEFNMSQSYNTVRDYKDMFLQTINQIEDKCSENGANVIIRFYPSLVGVSDKNVTFRVKAYIASNPEGKTFAEIFGGSSFSDKIAESNTAYVIDLNTNSGVGALEISLDKLCVVNIVWSEN